MMLKIHHDAKIKMPHDASRSIMMQKSRIKVSHLYSAYSYNQL